MYDGQAEQLQQLPQMVHYPYWHQIKESHTCTEKRVLQSICHSFFQRRYQIQATEEQEEEEQEQTDE